MLGILPVSVRGTRFVVCPTVSSGLILDHQSRGAPTGSRIVDGLRHLHDGDRDGVGCSRRTRRKRDQRIPKVGTPLGDTINVLVREGSPLCYVRSCLGTRGVSTIRGQPSHARGAAKDSKKFLGF